MESCNAENTTVDPDKEMQLGKPETNHYTDMSRINS